MGGGKVDEIPPERTFVVTVLQGRELIVEEPTVSCSKAVTRILDDESSWVGGLQTSVTEVIPLRDEVPGISWKFWKTTWFEGSSTAVEEGRSRAAKREFGLDILNNTRK